VSKLALEHFVVVDLAMNFLGELKLTESKMLLSLQFVLESSFVAS
jgi:hypothetical protein